MLTLSKINFYSMKSKKEKFVFKFKGIKKNVWKHLENPCF